jgi:hypothetical protein
MPKMTPRDNRVRTRRVKTSHLRNSLHISSIGELLKRGSGAPATADQHLDLKELFTIVKSLAGNELADHLRQLSRRENCLLVWVDSANWSARVRYMLLPRLAEVQAGYPWVTEIAVRVLRTPAPSAR